jgi:hypothetical protein
VIFLMIMQKLHGLPKKEGGSGIKVWNRAIMVKHLWSICNPAKSIWSLWLSFYLLRGRSV